MVSRLLSTRLGSLRSSLNSGSTSVLLRLVVWILNAVECLFAFGKVGGNIAWLNLCQFKLLLAHRLTIIEADVETTIHLNSLKFGLTSRTVNDRLMSLSYKFSHKGPALRVRTSSLCRRCGDNLCGRSVRLA